MTDSSCVQEKWHVKEFKTSTLSAQVIAGLHNSCINVEAELERLRECCEEIRIERDEARQHARIHGMQVATLQHEVDSLKQQVDDLTAGNSELCRRLEIAKYELAAARRTREAS